MECNRDARDQIESQYMNSQLYYSNTRSGQKRHRYSQKEDDVVFNSESDVRLEKRIK